MLPLAKCSESVAIKGWFICYTFLVAVAPFPVSPEGGKPCVFVISEFQNLRIVSSRKAASIIHCSFFIVNSSRTHSVRPYNVNSYLRFPNALIFKSSNNEIIGQLKSLAKVEQIANKTTAPPKFGGAVRFCTLVSSYWYRITASDAPIFIVPEQRPRPFSSILPSRQTAVHVPTGSL